MENTREFQDYRINTEVKKITQKKGIASFFHTVASKMHGYGHIVTKG